MSDDVSNLPVWPENDGLSRRYGDHAVPWWIQERDAYRARMEALERELRYVRAHFGDLIAMAGRIDALLAACERKEG